MTRRAVVLFNLGGPDDPSAVRPFLENLFSDPAILPLPAVIRRPLAAFIAARRERPARANYALMGGGSPLLGITGDQAAALEAALREAEPEHETRVFVAMRYWRPFVADAAAEVAAFDPDDIVLLPLYPQFSTTTTASSAAEWARTYRGKGRIRTVCCYPDELGLTVAHADTIESTWRDAGSPQSLRLLFSAHGLPEKVIRGGDPYQAQVEATAHAVAAQLSGAWDWRVCYQSRVGPMKWIGPSTEAEIRQAAADGLGVLIAPIAFVSEHVETLVELDHDYAAVAREVGCAPYLRAPALGLTPAFIGGLRHSVTAALAREAGVAPGAAWRCEGFARCPLLQEAR